MVSDLATETWSTTPSRDPEIRKQLQADDRVRLPSSLSD